MTAKMPCPFCGTQVGYTVEGSPDWYRDPSLPVYRIACYDTCRQYWLEAVSDPTARIDPDISAFLETLTPEQRMFISETTQRACDSGIAIVYDKRGLHYVTTDWHYANAAVQLYPLDNVSFRISGAGFDTANRLFFLDTAETRFTLRIHRGGTSVDRIRSEIYWLNALRNEAQVKTLTPVSGCNGHAIQNVSPKGFAPRYATAYNWIAGKTFNALPEAEKTPPLIRELGMMVGRMHALSQRLALPDWFTCPRYDRAWIEATRGTDTSPPLHAEFIAAQGIGRDVFGLIHADLAPHNIVIADGHPCPIDVVQFGFGYYMSDILTISRDFSEDELTLFFDGYREARPLPEDYRHQLALFDEIRTV